ncbi:hypothetical protein ZIOFF_051455 [Zingiber officinale]|uniref:Uncharacterized protein n=1 Tax=Zingiber officinale TaxID=94328 RepID=A0A8J5KHD2_ZINOF|nr:hypothetical protein ZIOFF_051455 [Zingiber officinale]
MSLPSSSKSRDYEEALASTEEISSPAIGFVVAKYVTNKDINRQNNTIIDLLLKINEKLDQLLIKPVSSNSEQVASLAKQLEGLTLGAVKAVPQKRSLSTIHVVAATPRTITELQGMRWTLQPSTVSQIRVPQENMVFLTQMIDEIPSENLVEDTPWEEDPNFDTNELSTNIEDEEEDLSSYFLGLSNLETDYRINSPSSVLPEDDNQQQPPYWDDTDTGSEEYWQQVVEQVEQIEEQFYTTQTNSLPGRMNTLSVHEDTSSTEEGEPNDWLPYINQSQAQESPQSENEDTQATEEAAYVGADSLVTEQLERLDYSILRSMMQQATTEKVLSSTSVISRGIIYLTHKRFLRGIVPGYDALSSFSDWGLSRAWDWLMYGSQSFGSPSSVEDVSL